jgi:3-hydroxy-3-methylglutaryl CoA synthase/uncharacterized OB-fold protein
MSEHGLTAFGAYVPRLRLERAAIAAAHRWMAPSLAGLARGARAFCGWDEDAVTMAVEAARDCCPPATRGSLTSLALASTTLPYADLQSSALVAGALALPATVETLDATGSQRAGLAALVAALRSGSGEALVVASDRPRARPASAQELGVGAGAAAFRVGSGQVLARLRGAANSTTQFIDHFRAATAAHDSLWEERWVRDEGYAKLVPPVVQAALAEAGLTIDQLDTLVVATPLKGMASALGRQLGFRGTVADGLDDGCGYTGAAHPLLLLAAALESAGPGQRLLLVGFGQGAQALILETTGALAAGRPARGVKGSLREGLLTRDYLRMASFYGEFSPDWGLRGERTGKAALTTAYREAEQLSAFVAGRCTRCGTVQFPQLASCVKPECGGPRSGFEPYPLTEEPAAVLTFTADWLSYHPSPPLQVGFVQFEVGARLLMELVDVGEAGLEVGTPVVVGRERG